MELKGLRPARRVERRRRTDRNLRRELRSVERESRSSDEENENGDATLSGEDTDVADRSDMSPPSPSPFPSHTGQAEQMCPAPCAPGCLHAKIGMPAAPAPAETTPSEGAALHTTSCIWSTGQMTAQKRKLKYPGLTGYGRCPGQDNLWTAQQFRTHRLQAVKMLRYLDKYTTLLSRQLGRRPKIIDACCCAFFRCGWFNQFVCWH